MRYQKALIVLVTLIIISFTNKSDCSNIVTKKPASIKTDKIIILENVPYISQLGRLDCGFASRAMLLEYFKNNFDSIAYPKSMYECASPYSFVYSPNQLILPYGGWYDNEYEWLAYLYGLTYKRIMPVKASNKEDAWNEYLKRIWGYLRGGIPVQTAISWPGAKEVKGKLYILSEFRPFWWEGITKKYRPQMHQVVIVGLDKSKGVIYINDPWGWLGRGKYMEMDLSFFRKVVEKVPLRIRYYTRVFQRSKGMPLEEGLKEELIRQRIEKELRGDPRVYDKPAPRYLYGLQGLKAFKKDLETGAFVKILKKRMQMQKISPLEVILFLNLGLYQQSFKASIAAEYLAVVDDIPGFKRVSNLHALYEKLYSSNEELVSVFKSFPDIELGLEKSELILKGMRKTIDELIGLAQTYLTKQ